MTKRLEMRLSLLGDLATEPGASDPADKSPGGTVFCRSCPPPVVVGGVGADDNPFDGWVGVGIKQADTEDVAKLDDGITSLGETGEGAINPCWLPPMLSCG